MIKKLRVLALAALAAVTMLTTTACSSDQPEPSPSPSVTQEVFPGQGAILGISGDPEVQCAEDFYPVELIRDGTTQYNGMKLSAEWSSDTIKVSSDKGFGVFVAGIAFGENGVRLPFSMRDAGLDPKASEFVIDAKRHFAKVADSRIVAVTLCAGGM